MNKKLLFGLFAIIFGLLLAIGPQTIFYVCDTDGEMIMKCHWTAQTVLGIGILIAILGVIFLAQKSRRAQAAISIAAALNGILAYLIPNVLIGVCDGIHMHCHAVAKPAISVLSILIAAISFVNAASLYGKERKSDGKINEADNK